ncbi:Dihydrofolate reductase [Collichthys lucidus]|uniref:dihydrofolate reductase n=1 Tax=Collichthys lucidus TaxID=240159 RepID=A0A4U5UGJ5_COLLU|nr:Dihydrofolate reductase [Collichthys lucidus]
MPLHMNEASGSWCRSRSRLFDRLLEMEMNQDNMQRKPVRLIAAACNNSGIGKDGKVPWNLPTVPDHAHFLCQDFESAVHLAAQPPLADLIDTVWVVGGTRVYKDALKHPWCDLVYLTHVMADFDCDVFFPEFNRGLYQLQESIFVAARRICLSVSQSAAYVNDSLYSG